ncbi:hypothetical protein BH23PLA1_BH23PLA1_40570 [soil metagenome]
MPSPFPGKNPYFEQAAHWPDFHAEFLSALRRELAPRIAPAYIIQLEEHLYVHEMPEEPRTFRGRADLGVTSRPGAALMADPVGVGLLEAPARIQLPMPDVERVGYLEIRDRRGRERVAVIELLSPTNKRSGPDREQYLAKRRAILAGQAHLIEIDLLRGGPPLPPVDRPPGAYSVLLSRAERRPEADYWPIGLRDRLPALPIPLRAGEPDAAVDLQEVLHRAHDGPGYELFLYEGSPEPPLSAEEADWARPFVPAGF